MKISRLSFGVNCWLEVIQYPDPMAFGYQGISRVRSNETGAAGDEDVHKTPLSSVQNL
jgi:hypothetical protein